MKTALINLTGPGPLPPLSYGDQIAALITTTTPPLVAGGPAMLSFRPDTSGPKVAKLELLISPDFGASVPERATLAKTNKGFAILVPEVAGDEDGVIAVAWVGSWAHRYAIRPEAAVGPRFGEIVAKACGYGAWGSGYVALVVLRRGQWHVSTPAKGSRFFVHLSADGVLAGGLCSVAQIPDDLL